MKTNSGQQWYQSIGLPAFTGNDFTYFYSAAILFYTKLIRVLKIHCFV